MDAQLVLSWAWLVKIGQIVNGLEGEKCSKWTEIDEECNTVT